jgi:hypothetical protein
LLSGLSLVERCFGYASRGVNLDVALQVIVAAVSTVRREARRELLSGEVAAHLPSGAVGEAWLSRSWRVWFLSAYNFPSAVLLLISFSDLAVAQKLSNYTPLLA